jgi:hypothetical protein
MKSGSGSKTGKLTPKQLARFKTVMFSKPLKELAEDFPVSVSQLCRIRSGQHWN